MEKVKIYNVKIKHSNQGVLLIVKDISFPINNVDPKYIESSFFSILKINVNEQSFVVKGLRSIWEYLPNSTYDWSEKREDNKVFDLYCKITDLQKSQ